jgi:PAS domain S-box-containing protein
MCRRLLTVRAFSQLPHYLSLENPCTPSGIFIASVPIPHKLGYGSSSEGNNVEQDCYRILADATYDWESWLTGDGIVHWVNPSVQRFTGWSVAECLSLTDYPLPLVHAEDRGQVAALLSAGMSGAAGNDVEFRVVHRLGGLVHVAASWQPVEIVGYPRGLRLSIRDISMRKSAERALQGSESLYRSIVAGAWEGIWLLDVEGRTEFVNQRMAELLGASPQQLEGACLQEFLEGSLRSELLGDRSRVVLRNRRGESVNVFLSAAPRRTTEGGFGGFVLMALEELGATGCAVESAAGRLSDLSRVVAQVAHEINNPLASVRNALRLLREDSLTGAERLEFHRLIDGEIERIGRVVRRMLDLRGTDANAAEGPGQVFVVQDELQSLVRLLTPTADMQGVLLRFSATVEGVRLQLPLDEFRQILFNLLMNAIEASQVGGYVQLNAVELPTGAVEFSIRDAGHGISDSSRPRLFEPFFSTRTHRDGSDPAVRGMGLAICRNLAERLQLTIDYSTQEGVGTEFCVRIPENRRIV